MDFKSLFFSFRGRINRQRFWLAHFAISFCLLLALFVIFTSFSQDISTGGGSSDNGSWQYSYIDAHLSGLGQALYFIINLLAAWTGFAITAKRWHDRDKSGWWILIILVPLIGPIWALVECGFLRGTQGTNRFGEDPLALN